MRCSDKTMLLYAVTDRAWTGKESLYESIKKSLLSMQHTRHTVYSFMRGGE